jgi:hypothetical protein
MPKRHRKTVRTLVDTAFLRHSSLELSAYCNLQCIMSVICGKTACAVAAEITRVPASLSHANGGGGGPSPESGLET